MRIVFRADASSNLGGGHVMRCATLAHALMKRGAEVVFLCRMLKGNFCDWLENSGFQVIRLHETVPDLQSDLVETGAALAKLGLIDWLVVDSYSLDVRWEESMRPYICRIMVIDDLADRMHDCDILLDQNYIHNSETRYNDLVPLNCNKLLGPRYALLRGEFYEARKRLRVRKGEASRLLICFGATDPTEHTVAAMHALSRCGLEFERIDVATSPQNPLVSELRDWCSSQPTVRFHCPATNLVGLLEEADLAIGAGGTMNWERACLGLPTIAFGVAENQEPILASLIHDGFLLGEPSMRDPSEETMAAWMVVAKRSACLLEGLSARSAALVDGRGVERVVDHMIQEEFNYRPATLADSKSLFEWRNSSSVSGVSASGKVPDFYSHEIWLKTVLNDRNRILLIVEKKTQPIGVVRFDCNGDKAKISIYRVPGAENGRGLIRQSTEWLKRNKSEIRRIVADVLPNNVMSQAAFRAAGYRDSMCHLSLEL